MRSVRVPGWATAACFLVALAPAQTVLAQSPSAPPAPAAAFPPVPPVEPAIPTATQPRAPASPATPPAAPTSAPTAATSDPSTPPAAGLLQGGANDGGVAASTRDSAPDPNAGESCADGLRNGPESDVDCGGDCPPCGRRKLCADANDCESGLCSEGKCVERPYRRGEAVPHGYVVTMSRRDAAATARITGVFFLGISYGLAFAGAVAYPSRLQALYIPVAGPWVAMGRVEKQSGRALLLADGSLQGAGTILILGGLLVAGRQLVREVPDLGGRERPHLATVYIAPRGGVDSAGVDLGLRF